MLYRITIITSSIEKQDESDQVHHLKQGVN